MTSAPDFSQTVALFGGSFDPPHLGHLHVAEVVLKDLPDISQFYFVPVFLSPGKAPPCAPAQLRLGWLREICANSELKVWDWEIRQGVESYTIDTLRHCANIGSVKEKLFLVLGQDSYENLPRWKEANLIRNYCKIAIIARSTQEIELQNMEDVILPCIPYKTSSTELRNELSKGNFQSPHLPRGILSHLKSLALQGENPYAKGKNP